MDLKFFGDGEARHQGRQTGMVGHLRLAQIPHDRRYQGFQATVPVEEALVYIGRFIGNDSTALPQGD